MARGLMLVLALVATVAHAQETSKATKGSKGAVLPQREQRATVAVRPAVEPRLNGGAKAGAVTVKGTSAKQTDCSGYQTLLSGEIPAVHTYAPPPPDRPGEPTNAGKQASYVKAVQRCGDLYLVQILSLTPWTIAHARVEGPNGEELQVNAVGSSKANGDEWGINVIAVQVPPGVTVTALILHLVGDDGRVALLDARDLP